MKKLASVLLAGIFLIAPLFTLANGLVPCGGIGEQPCQTCDVVNLVNNVIQWLVVVLGTIAALVIIYAGVKLVMSGGNQAAMEESKSMITNIIIGYIIVLSGWLLIDFGMKALINEGAFGVWNAVQCVAQREVKLTPQVELTFEGRQTASGANESSFSSGDTTMVVAGIRASGDVRAMAEAAARAAGITDLKQIKTYVALISQESSMCRNKTGPSTKYGTAYGCGQMLLSTARAYDANVTAAKLRDDNAYNLSLSARYYADQMRRYNGNISLTLASYNGGDKANENSSRCPGQLAWQCELNGGYAQTRNYVSNINQVAAGL